MAQADGWSDRPRSRSKINDWGNVTMTVFNAKVPQPARRPLPVRLGALGLAIGLAAGFTAVQAAPQSASGGNAVAPASSLDPAKQLPGAISVSDIDFKRGDGGAGRLILRFNGDGAAPDLRATGSTVTINVAPNQAPTANPETVATLGVPLTINVLANDTDPEGNLPLAVNSVTQPAPGRGTVSTDGSQVTYTPPATVTTAFTTTFTYQARDSLGGLSTPGTVTVNVSPRPAAETFAVTAATVTARSNNRYNWDLSGTSSVTTGNTVTVRVTTTTGVQTLGTATVALTGRWRLAVSNSTTIIPTAAPTATITTSQGTTRTVNVTVQ